jgi:hypothetical protein
MMFRLPSAMRLRSLAKNLPKLTKLAGVERPDQARYAGLLLQSWRSVRPLAVSLPGLVAMVAAVACKPSAPPAPPRPPALSVPSPSTKLPPYGVCPQGAVKCDPERLRMLQDSLTALEKRHRSRDSLSRLLTPQHDFRFHPLPEPPRTLRPWNGPEWERRGPMDDYRRGLGLPPRDTPQARRT